MFIIDGDRRISGDFAAHIARLESLLIDLERISNGEFPTDKELEASPLINPFAVVARPSVCLIGGNGGHPHLTKPAIRTSEVWLLAPELGWARTYSRFYRLGAPLYPGCSYNSADEHNP